MSQKTRSSDLKSQALQKDILRAIISFATTFDLFLANEKSVNAIFAKSVLDNMLLGAEALVKAFLQISVSRRAQIKPHLDQQYSGICGTNEHSEFLFGPNIVESLKAAKSVSTVMRGAVNRVPQYSARFASYNRRSLNFRRPYLRGQSFRGRQSGPQSQPTGDWKQSFRFPKQN